ncbi:hypothetical protein BRADI_3g04181v3 [Brachypodium distachyon]|uniref:Uncharacterized protein n=1 Tax=Brachypodium distachyon TaxID=15368 RepID=A0A0Q3F4T9_BRADI|nr:hypothetical protein BRADI_3g04181v3 [Brachypodium distachyon]
MDSPPKKKPRDEHRSRRRTAATAISSVNRAATQRAKVLVCNWSVTEWWPFLVFFLLSGVFSW